MELFYRFLQCATFVRRITKDQKQQWALVCNAIDQGVSNNFMSHALKHVVFCARRPGTIWTMSNIADIVNIITVNWYELILCLINQKNYPIHHVSHPKCFSP